MHMVDLSVGSAGERQVAMEQDATQSWVLEQRSIDETLLTQLQSALDRQPWEFDALDRKASALLSTAGIIVTILLALLGWSFSKPPTQPGVCPLAFIVGISLFVAVVGVAIWALWVRPFWRPVYIAVKEIEEYRSLGRNDLTRQLLHQHIGAHQINQDTKNEKIFKVKLASVLLFLGILYLAILAVYVVWS